MASLPAPALAAAGGGAGAGAVEAPESLELAVVTSPIVGTFYRAPDPSSPSFVEVGQTVRKGQTLFKVEPDEKLVVEDPAERARRIRARTDEYLASVL